MKRALVFLPMAAAIAGALVACGEGNDGGNVTTPTPSPTPVATISGVVTGSYFQKAKVCIDANNNGVCDTGETSTTTDASGAFTLTGTGALVAEIGTDAVRYDPDTKTSTPVTSKLVFRAPSGSTVVSALTTEVVAIAGTNGGDIAAAQSTLATRLGVTIAQVMEDQNKEADTNVKAILKAESDQGITRIATAVAAGGDVTKALTNALALDQIQNVVVIYAENRGFDNLYGLFPGANGIPGVNPTATGSVAKQTDYDDSVLPYLPKTWGGLTAAGQSVTISEAMTATFPNGMFQIDDPKGLLNTGVTLDQSVLTRDLVHRFYNNQMQINGGKNDKYAAYSDAGGLSMGYFDGSKMQMWKVAQNYVLADNLFQGAFGGSFLNHQYLICACAPTYPNAEDASSPVKNAIAAIDTDANGNFVRLTPGTNAPASSLTSAPVYKRDAAITPKDASGMYYAVNTMQPAYQPSSVAPPSTDSTKLYADTTSASYLPPQTQTNIGDLLNAKKVSWAWYGGAWASTLAQAKAGRTFASPIPNFQFHHQPFNYYAEFDPVTHAADRATHLKDFDTDMLNDIKNGTLPAVAFYKPQGNLNQHNGYANVTDGDSHIADLIAKLQASPQWKHMLVIVTYDENGGFYDHAAVPKADRWGPGTRIPAIIVSPYAKKGTVDHTQYDTASILRFITHRYSLPVLPGLTQRDNALVANGGKPMGDFTAALDFTQSVQ